MFFVQSQIWYLTELLFAILLTDIHLFVFASSDMDMLVFIFMLIELLEEDHYAHTLYFVFTAAISQAV